METAIATGRQAPSYKAILLSSLGGALEFYDFIIFGTFAAYLSKAFFPLKDATSSLLLTFAVLGAGYVARPVGGLLFGVRGDTKGRRGTFILSILVMSGATIAIGLLPTFEQAGVIASAAFVVLRLLQGFSLGGELAGAITYVVEIAPRRRITFACGIIFGCVSSGVLLATSVSTLLHALLDAAQMQQYGWRIAFVIGGLLGIVSWIVRHALAESPEFVRMKRTAAASSGRGPLATLLSTHAIQILVAVGATCVVATFNGLLFAHMPAYLGRTLGYSGPEIALALNIASGVTALSLVAATWVADIVPRRLVFRLGCVVIGLGALPAYKALVAHELPLSTIFLLIGLSAAFTHGTFAAIIADVFPTPIRFSGVALALNGGAVIFSGLAPILATWLIETTGVQEAPAYLLVGSACLAFATSFALKAYEGEIDGTANSIRPGDANTNETAEEPA
jgi:MHS family proline/betaine transporter-like MFS transporter